MTLQVAAVGAVVLGLIGVVLLAAALLAGGVAVVALIERLRHGRGIFFADVEIFVFLAVLGALSGALALLGSRALSKHPQTSEPNR